MGMYVYRITGEQVLCSDGQKAEVAVYAYKPCGDSRLNAKWARQTGCERARAIAHKREILPRVAIKAGAGLFGSVYENPHRWTSFLDDCNLGTDRMPIVKDVEVRA